MSSPPNPSHSPPYPPPSTLPSTSKKRPSSTTSTPSNPSKRRKPSTAHSVTGTASSAHPLRQTSFPPPERDDDHGGFSANGGTAVRSPSVESSVAGGSAVGGRGRKGRGGGRTRGGGGRRGRPSATATAATSVVDGQTGGRKSGSRSVVSGSATGRGGGAAGDEDEDGGEDDEDAGEGLMADGAEGEVDKDQERQKLSILVEAFNPTQSDRYDMYRRAKLPPATVRKLTNQTLSQSVPENVVKTINGFTKVFVGEIVEKAREVQREWLLASSSSFSSPSSSTTSDHITSLSSTSLTKGESNLDAEAPPLLPDHLREAMRRYRRDREGGGSGLRGFSLTAMGGGFATGTGGRRLFR
ncbi:MAG: hypothetical protein M1817_000530 [Caeruleum heppii]|nr:MAG: hypothetical protein M1817_000530 [Caeruleum heppii]